MSTQLAMNVNLSSRRRPCLLVVQTVLMDQFGLEVQEILVVQSDLERLSILYFQ